MEKRVQVHRFLGLPRRASVREMEQRCEALLDWFESDDVPPEVRSWISGPARLVQEIYDDLGAPEASPAIPVEGVEGKERAQGRRRPQGGGWMSTLASSLTSPGALVAAGLVLVVAIAAALWLGTAGGNGQTPSGQDASSGAFLDSSQARIAELEVLVATNPQNQSALFELGETYITGGDWENTIVWFTRLLEVQPSNTHAILDVGTANMNLGRYAEAEKAFARALEVEPENAQAHYNAGFLSAFRTDAPDVPTAVGHWQEVVRLAPESELAKAAREHLAQFQAAGVPK